jgi:hypothetical protein
MPARQLYNDYDFSAAGRAQWGESVRIENSSGGRPRRKITTHRVVVWFLESSFSDNMARYRDLKAALETPEGIFRVTDETGRDVVPAQRVKVMPHDLPPQWAQNLAEVSVQFEGVQEITGATEFDALMTPDGGAAVVLPNISGWVEGIATVRDSIDVPNRRQSLMTIALSGSVRANPELLPAERLLYLHQQKELIETAGDAKNGRLVFEGAGFDAVVEVESVSCDPKDGNDEMTWSMQVRKRRFPGWEYVETELKISTKDDQMANSRITTVAGIIRASARANADARLLEIRTAYSTSGRMFMEGGFDDTQMTGADGDTDAHAWPFSLVFREVLPGAVESYTLSVAPRTDFSGQVTMVYSGKVTAATEAAALAKAAALGAGKHPVMVGSDRTSGFISASGADAQMVEVTFSYSYLTRDTVRRLDLTSVTQRDPFGASSITVSGRAAAGTEAAALEFARTYRPSGMRLESTESAAKMIVEAASVLKEVGFSYRAHLDPDSGTLSYKKQVSEDSMSRKKVVVFSGRAIAANEAGATTLIDALAVVSGGKLLRNVRTPDFRQGSDTTTHFLGTEFDIAFSVPLAANGDDILQAQWKLTVSPSGPVNVFTPIPGAVEHVQANTGTHSGMAEIAGTIETIGANTGRDWARTLSLPSGGYAEPVQESRTERFHEKSTTDVASYIFEFRYAARYPSLGAI